MREGSFPGWSMNYMLGRQVTGATLGLIGPGRIATAVAERAAGFRMRLLCHGPTPSPRMLELGRNPCPSTTCSSGPTSSASTSR